MPNLEARLARLEKLVKTGGIDIINLLDATQPQPKKNTFQYNSAGQVWMIDKEGETTDLSDIFSVVPPDGVSIGEQMDVFLIGGQSNASGKGVAASSPNPQPGTVYQWDGTLKEVTDELTGANTGSAWPSFGITWHNLTGRKICFVPSAVESSAQVAASDTGAGNWSTTGTLYGTAVSNYTNALAAVEAAGYTPIKRGILWSQGETDAIAINSATIVVGAYTTALSTMVTNFRTVFGSDLPFYIFRTGTRTDQSDTGYLAIRDAQDSFVYGDPLRNRMVFRNAIDFPARSLMIDVVHYSQAGYNEMGRIGAETIVSGNDWGLQKTTINGGNISYFLPTQYAKLGIGALNSVPTELLTVKSNNVFDTGLITASGTNNGALANLKSENLSSGSAAATGIRFYNDTGIKAQLLLYSTGSSNPGASVFILHQAGSSVPIRFAANTGDIEFAGGGTAISNVKSKHFVNGQWLFCPQNAGTPTRTNSTAAAIEIQSTTQGLLLPRMTTTQRDAIVGAVAGLTIYNTTTNKINFHNGTTWEAVTSA